MGSRGDLFISQVRRSRRTLLTRQRVGGTGLGALCLRFWRRAGGSITVKERLWGKGGGGALEERGSWWEKSKGS